MIQVVLLSPNSSEDPPPPQKRSSPKIEGYLSLKSGEDKKKRSLPQFGTIFGQNWWDLFRLTGTFLSDHPASGVRRIFERGAGA